MSVIEMDAYIQDVPLVDVLQMIHALLLTGAAVIHLCGRAWRWAELKEEEARIAARIAGIH